MSKKSSKSSTSRKTARKTEAPKVISRGSAEAPLPATEIPSAMADVPLPTPAAPVAATAPPAAQVAAAPASLDRSQIARLAFSKFVASGYVHGNHVEHWLAAEAELRNAR